MEKRKKLEFNNRAIRNHKATFISSTGKTKDRDYTPFNIAKTTQYKGLYLCEYKKGEKHFVLQFYIKEGTRRLRRFTIGRFNDNLNVITGETIFGIKQCTHRLFEICKEHQDEKGHWIKDPNLTVSFTQVNQSITIRDLIVEYCKAGFEKMRTGEKMTANSIRDKAFDMKHFLIEDCKNIEKDLKKMPKSKKPLFVEVVTNHKKIVYDAFKDH